MREEETAGTDGSVDVKSAGRGSVLIAAVALLASAVIGGAVGMGVIGPRVAAAPAAAEGGHEEAESSRHGKGHVDASRLYAIESLVVNPSGTSGMRFLIATVTVEMEDVKSLDALKARDAAARDALLHVLGSKSVEDLSDVAARDSLKRELASAISGVLGEKRVRQLFLPQFVLQ